MRFFLILSVLILCISADWWDSLTSSVSDKLSSAATWVKEEAGPAIRSKFDGAKETLQDPETHKAIREWASEKAESVSEFAQEEIIPEVKKVYDAFVESGKESTEKSNEIQIEERYSTRSRR